MKKLLLITAFLSSLMFSSACFAEWKLVGTNSHASFYVDFESIEIKKNWFWEKSKESVYHWQLLNYTKPVKGALSIKFYFEADCGVPPRNRPRALRGYKQPMARGKEVMSGNKVGSWRYPSPGSAGENIFYRVCAAAKKK